MRSLVTVFLLCIILIVCLSLFRHGIPIPPEILSPFALLIILLLVGICFALQGIMLTGCLVQLLLILLLGALVMELFPGIAHHFHLHGLLKIRHCLGL